MIVIEEIPDTPNQNSTPNADSIVQTPQLSYKDMYKDFIGEPLKSNFVKAMMQKEINESIFELPQRKENTPEKKAFYKHLRQITKVQEDGHHDWIGMLCSVCNEIPSNLQKDVCNALDDLYGHDHDYFEIPQYAIEYGYANKPNTLFSFLGDVYDYLPQKIVDDIMKLK
ncbi:MAG: hypothetical protein MJZ34_04975 [Paludibacteraceae bacterium]|nr:hypothetical protein [Paludibacteraceae bacterium]